MKNTSKTSKIDRLASALGQGEELSVAQIRARFGLANPTSTIAKLRVEVSPNRIDLVETRTGVRKYSYVAV